MSTDHRIGGIGANGQRKVLVLETSVIIGLLRPRPESGEVELKIHW
jgi:hypothetical protein